ncbi:hypotheticalsprotein [Cercospora beticola]|uniref:Hypotheticalsprotein n=1 Tax=Cercospora beticola TaxID=122368 RepID=A0A2G5I2T7_CERBT|nr:hypotheticalsprotein [Cercospora beticola]PIA99126.1 hypotheticalsprotein [Cercospora beticola]WPA99884.1 hypothetical protein RHO25_004504 [Cercospora beticola]CAK1361945.1 unnamed protein product [Cercospora beticola]
MVNSDDSEPARVHNDGYAVEHSSARGDSTDTTGAETLSRAVDSQASSSAPGQGSIRQEEYPLPSKNSSSLFYYEPQGELIQHAGRSTDDPEISIPHPISSSRGHYTTHGQAAGANPATALQGPTETALNTLPSERDHEEDLESAPPKRAHRDMSTSDQEFMYSSAPFHQSQQHPTEGSTSSINHQQQTFIDPSITMVLPARKVFPIQIGDKLFRLSGASISSDAPSYFSQFFEEQMKNNEGAESCRTLYIDRDPKTFEDISLHLQGYHIEPRDGAHFVKLFADAQFFSLPRLTAQLFASTIYVRVGEQEFRIPKDLFSNPGDSPNYFSLGFSSFFSTPTDRLPGLSQQSLIRPPSLLPPSVPTRSARVFLDLLHLLQGYDLHIRDEEHRAELLRDARYYHLKGLEQRLIPHRIAFNLRRQKSEILLRLQDVHKNGVGVVSDCGAGGAAAIPGWVCYQRPYVDTEAHILIVEVSGEESTTVELEPAASSTTNARMARVTLHNETTIILGRLLCAIAEKVKLPHIQPVEPIATGRTGAYNGIKNQSQHSAPAHSTIKMHIGPDADVVVNGHRQAIGNQIDTVDEMDVDDAQRPAANARKVRQDVNANASQATNWVVSKAQWRLRVQPRKNGFEVILDAVKIEACSNERSRNAASDFLM